MANYEVEWSISARGIVEVEAESVAEAEEIAGEIDTGRLFGNALRVDWDASATERSEL